MLFVVVSSQCCCLDEDIKTGEKVVGRRFLEGCNRLSKLAAVFSDYDLDGSDLPLWEVGPPLGAESSDTHISYCNE